MPGSSRPARLLAALVPVLIWTVMLGACSRPARPSHPDTGELLVRADCEDVLVWVDGRFAGSTSRIGKSLRVRCEAGRREIFCSAPGRVDLVESLEVPEGKCVEVEARLGAAALPRPPPDFEPLIGLGRTLRGILEPAPAPGAAAGSRSYRMLGRDGDRLLLIVNASLFPIIPGLTRLEDGQNRVLHANRRPVAGDQGALRLDFGVSGRRRVSTEAGFRQSHSPESLRRPGGKRPARAGVEERQSSRFTGASLSAAVTGMIQPRRSSTRPRPRINSASPSRRRRTSAGSGRKL